MAVEKRIQSYPRTLGELFVAILDEGVIEALSSTADEISALFASEVARRFGVNIKPSILLELQIHGISRDLWCLRGLIDAYCSSFVYV